MLLELLNYYQIELIWLPGHQGIESNEKSDEYEVIGSFLNESMAYNDDLTPSVVMTKKVATKWSAIDKNASVSKVAKKNSFHRVIDSFLVDIFTGHSMIGFLDESWERIM